MIQLSIEKLQLLGQLIREKYGIPEKDLPDYLKWIQYYLNFVQRYEVFSAIRLLTRLNFIRSI